MPKKKKDEPVIAAEPSGMNDYEVDNGLRTLMDAHKISGNKDLMKKIKKAAQEKKKSINGISMIFGKDEDEDDGEIKSIEDIKKARKKMADE